MTTTAPALRPAPMAHPSRVLLVSGSLGAGHDAAARAVEERARRLWPHAEIARAETLGRATGPLFRAIYAGSVRRLPWLYALYFRLLCSVPPFRAGTRAVIGRWSARGLAVQLDRHRPDLVVATFPEAITGLARLRRLGRLPMPVVALVVDPAPHPLWLDRTLDLHLVSTETGAALARRTAPGAAVRVSALPVSADFTPPPDRPARGRPLVYVSCGSMVFGDVGAACAAVLDGGGDVLVSAGRNAAIRKKLDQVAARHQHGDRMQVTDWVDDPAAVTRDCDLVVTNAGGVTALEALACARPLLLFAPIPGHGRANAAVLADAGLARVCPKPADLATAVATLADPARRAVESRRLRERFAGNELAADLDAVTPAGSPEVSRPGSRMRAQDAFFLHVATADVPQQVGARIVIADPADRDDWVAYLAELIRTRVPHIEVLRRRPARPRPGRPLHWLIDDVPDPARHLRPGIVEIGPDGDHPTWDDAIAAFFATAVDPFAVGWEVQIARDRAAQQIAVLAKVHHALGDGLAVTDGLIRLLTDEEAQQRPAAPASEVPPAHEQLRARARRAVTIVRGVVSLAGAGAAGRSPLTGAGSGPAHRRASLVVDGARVRAAARAQGVGTTVLLLAVVAEALHTLLAERNLDGAPDRIRAMVPLTTRTSAGVNSRTPGNRTAAVSLDLPTGPMPRAERIARVARALEDGTAAGQPEAAAAVLTVLGLLPGRLQALLVRRIYGHRFFHVPASVMPGARRPLHARGGRLVQVVPVLPLAEGVGLAVGALHWGRTTGIGITADPALVPEIEGIPARIDASLAGMSRG